MKTANIIIAIFGMAAWNAQAQEMTAGSAQEDSTDWGAALQQDAHVDTPKQYVEQGNDFFAEIAERNSVSNWKWAANYSSRNEDQCWYQTEDDQDHHTLRIQNRGKKLVRVKLWAAEASGIKEFVLHPNGLDDRSIIFNGTVNWRWEFTEEKEQSVDNTAIEWEPRGGEYAYDKSIGIQRFNGRWKHWLRFRQANWHGVPIYYTNICFNGKAVVNRLITLCEYGRLEAFASYIDDSKGPEVWTWSADQSDDGPQRAEIRR